MLASRSALLIVLAAALLAASSVSAEGAAGSERDSVPFPRTSRAALKLHVRDAVQLTGDGTDRKAPLEFAREFREALKAALVEQGFTVVTSATPGAVSVQLSARISTGWAPFIWSFEHVEETTVTFENEGVVVATLRGPGKAIANYGTSYPNGATLLALAAAGSPQLAALARDAGRAATLLVNDAGGAATAPGPVLATNERWRAVARRESRLAVLEFRGALPPNILGALADEARGAALNATADVGCTVMTRESLAAVLRDMGRSAQCGDGECEVDVARSIGADLVLSGEVMKIEGTQVLTMKLHESAKGALLATARAQARTSLALLEAARPAAASLFRAP